MRRSNKGTAGAIAFAAVVGMGLGTPAAAQDAAAPQPAKNAEKNAEASRPAAPKQASKPIVLRAGALEGKVVGLDGKTPVAGAPVILEDAKGQEVVKTVSGADGRFSIAEKPAGSYKLSIGSAQGTIQLDVAAKPTSLTVVLPAEIAKAIRAAQGAEATTTILGIEMAETTAIVVGGTIGVVVGVGAAVGIGIAVDDSLDNDQPGDNAPVSPSGQ